MDLGMKEQSALVMGGSRGLGHAIATAFSQEGMQVAIAARDQQTLEEAAARIGARPYRASFDEPHAVHDMVSRVLADAGRLDVLVVNTGGPPKSSVFDATAADWKHAFDALWLPATEAVRAVLPAMCEQRYGRIIFITSVSAVEPEPALIFSSALRAGLHGMVNALSKDVAEKGVTVNAVMPGYINTQRLIDLGASLDTMKLRIPARRYGEADELASLVTFLASRRAGYVTGQAIACDGGLLRGI